MTTAKDSGEGEADAAGAGAGARGERLVRLFTGEANPEAGDGPGSERLGGDAQDARGPGEQGNAAAGHGRRADQHGLAGEVLVAQAGRALSPGPVGGSDEPRGELAEDGGGVPVVDGRAEDESVGGVDLGEDGLQVVLLHAAAALQPRGLGASAAVGAEQQMLVREIEGVRVGTMFLRAGENGLHRGVDGASLAIAADDCHDLLSHGEPPVTRENSVVLDGAVWDEGADGGWEKNAGGLNEAPPACAKLVGALVQKQAKAKAKNLSVNK